MAYDKKDLFHEVFFNIITYRLKKNLKKFCRSEIYH